MECKKGCRLGQVGLRRILLKSGFITMKLLDFTSFQCPI